MNRSEIITTPKSLIRTKLKPGEKHLYRSDDHRQNFLDCVKTRKEPAAPARVAHRSIMVAHLGVISMKLGRKVNWDPKKELFVNDPEADRMLSRPMRPPYTL